MNKIAEEILAEKYREDAKRVDEWVKHQPHKYCADWFGTSVYSESNARASDRSGV